MLYGDDRELWGEDDFWATPAQTNGRGDCQDFAIAKYFSLVRRVESSEKLRLTFVKALRQNQAHMVLGKAPQRISRPPQSLARGQELSERAMADGPLQPQPRG